MRRSFEDPHTDAFGLYLLMYIVILLVHTYISLRRSAGLVMYNVKDGRISYFSLDVLLNLRWSDEAQGDNAYGQ